MYNEAYLTLFQELRKYSFKTCNNPKLDKLAEMVKKAFSRGRSEDSRGIVFVKTRDLAKAIVNWMNETPGLRELKPIQFVGQNMSADKGGKSMLKINIFSGSFICKLSV